MPELSKGARVIQAELDKYGLKLKVKEFAQSTRTSLEAAHAVGCELGQIAKAIVFRGRTSGNAVCVIASGANRVDEKKLRAILGEKTDKADADFVLKQTGFAIGGVPPVGHQVKTYLDEDLFKYGEIWAAAGTPHAIFCLTPDDLLKITGAEVIHIKQ